MQTASCLLDTTQESRIIIEPVFKPVLLHFEADQQSRRFAVARDNDLLVFCLPQKSGQIVLDFRQWNFLHCVFAYCASDASVSDLVTIAKIFDGRTRNIIEHPDIVNAQPIRGDAVLATV